MSIVPLMQRFVDEELASSKELAARIVAGTLQLLRDSRDGCGSAERALHLEIAAALQQRADDYQRAFVAALTQRANDELRAPGGGSAPDAKGAANGFELVDESKVEIDIEISRAMQLIDTTAEWQLRELQTFTSTLVGQDHVSAESNPLRPLVYASALWQAAGAAADVQAQRTLLLRLSAGVAAGLLKNAWAAACTRLESQGIEPGTYRTVLLPPGAVSGRGAGGDRYRAAALGTLLPSMPAGGAAIGAVRRLGHHCQALVASAGDGSGRQIIELLSRVYEAILSDAQLPAAFRAVLARMQVSTLRIALRDAATMESHDHEVWRLMDRIGAASIAYPEHGDARRRALLAFCQSLAEEVAASPSPDASLYRRSLNRLDAFLAEQLQAQLLAAQPALDALQLAERRESLEQLLSLRLTEQLASLRTTPGIRRFVSGAWAKVLADVITRSGEHSELARSYLKSADDLLWSLQIPDHPQSRQRLLGLLPVLLQRLRSGMERIALPATQQQAVLNELMAVHTEALRPGGRAAVSALTPEQIVQRMRDEVVPQTPVLPAFSDSLIDLSSLDTVPAELLSAEDTDSEDAASRRVEELRSADQMQIFLLGRWICVQLMWRSERGLFFLFAGDAAGRTHSITRRALERLGGAGLIRPIEARPLLQRAVDSLLHQLSPRH